VGIAEQHAVTLAAGIACEDMHPVVAIYSTFLQRAYDQLIHDVALQNLPVLFAIDRGGLVGPDGATHAGNFDLSYLRCIPNIVVMTPADENECRQMLYTGYQYQGPAAVRYPRGTGLGVDIEKEMQSLEIGKGEIRRQGQRVAILAFGSMVGAALCAAEQINATVANMRFVKPLDHALIDKLAAEHDLLITIEENVIAGGAGSAVNEYLQKQHISSSIINMGLPDRFIEQGARDELLAMCGLTAQDIINNVRAFDSQDCQSGSRRLIS
jgi:1-deoxy-D-xylulose-5-phosphate synthase